MSRAWASIRECPLRPLHSGDVDMRLYVPEVMSLCYKLGLSDSLWCEDAAVRHRVAANRNNMPLFPDESAD
jgi:hypothetical protein